jgi:UDP-GlcNAc3NAcA epimerase
MKKVLFIIGARPQFIKHAPIEIAAKGVFNTVSVHTGQHYDYRMSQIFFDELKISKPDYNLGVHGGDHGQQTGRMMVDLENVVVSEKPDFVVVYGDTNSTLAGALVASKLHIPVVHIEAGLRSFNKSMPEEINRIVTDHVSSVLFVPTETGVNNLANEGITQNVFLIGDVMYDMIRICEKHNVIQSNNNGNGNQDAYYFATIHRPYNTDDLNRMHEILSAFDNLPLPVKFAVHPRTRQRIDQSFDIHSFKNIHFSEPLSYFDNIRAINNSELVITDSGGIQKEAYMLKKKCITVRSETEWVETLKNGWNTLVFEQIDKMKEAIDRPTGEYINGLYGDGDAAVSIIEVLKRL